MIIDKRRAWLGLLGLLLPLAVVAAPPLHEPPPAAQAAQRAAQPDGLWSRLLGDGPSTVRGLDPVIFIELSPVTASEPALRLPDDQQDTP